MNAPVTDPAVLAAFSQSPASASPEFVDSLIQQESRGNAAAVGPANHTGERALGLMQVLPSTGREVAAKLGLPTDDIEHRLLNADYNRQVGTAYINDLLTKYGDPTLALQAYNWGPRSLDNALGGGGAIPANVRQYASEILGRLSGGGQSLGQPVTDPDVLAAFADTGVGAEPSWTDVFKGSLATGLKEAFTSTTQALTPFQDRGKPPAPDTPVGRLIAKPLSEGWNDPKWYAAQFLYGTAASSPAMGAGLAGAAAGTPAGPVGEFVGGVAGFSAGAAMQAIAPAYQKARADGLTHDQAFDRAWEEAGISAGFGAVMGAAPILRIAKGAISNALAQIFIVQPALGVAQEATTTAAEGKKQDLEQLATAALQQAGAGAILAGGHAVIRSMLPESKAKPPPGKGTPPPGAPAAQPTGPVGPAGISETPPETTIPTEEAPTPAPAPPEPSPAPSPTTPEPGPAPPSVDEINRALGQGRDVRYQGRKVTAASPTGVVVEGLGNVPLPAQVDIAPETPPIAAPTTAAPEAEIKPQEERAPPAATPVPAEAPEAQAAPAPAAPAAKLPDYVQENIERNWTLAQKLGVVPDIERMAAEGKTALQTSNELGDRLKTLDEAAAANGTPWEARGDRQNLIRAVRNKLRIPSQDERGEFEKWLADYQARTAPEKPPESGTPAPEQKPTPVEPGQPVAEKTTERPFEQYVTPATKAVRETDVQLTPEAMGEKLGIEPAIAKRVLDRLAGQGVIKQGKAGGYRRLPKLGPQDLFRFLAAKGGIHPDSEAAKNLRGENPFLPGQGQLIRPEGLTDDRAREMATEAGYLKEGASINDYLDAMDRQGRGQRVFIPEEAEKADKSAGKADKSTERDLAGRDVQAAIDKQGLTNVSERARKEATDAVMRGEKDPDDAIIDALEREAMQGGGEEVAVQPGPSEAEGEEAPFPEPEAGKKPAAAPGPEGRGPPAPEVRGRPGEERPPVPAGEATADDKAVLADKGLTVTFEEGRARRSGETFKVWRVTGETKPVRKILRSLGAKWYEPKQAWSFFDADPTAKIAAALRDASKPKRQRPARPAAGRPAGGEAGGEPGTDFWRGVERGNLEPPSAANSASTVEGFDENLFGEPTESYGEPERVKPRLAIGVPETKPITTAELIARGKDAGIPKEVMIEQIKDIGSIQMAHAAGKGAFVLASETGTGKTFVLGGAIREIQRRDPNRKFIYVTMNRRLIRQIRQDLADFGLDRVKYTTYNELATKPLPDVDKNTVLIFDEAHNLKNVGGSKVGAAAAKIMRQGNFTVFSSATPFENPVEAEYLSNSGLFEKHGTTFRGWAIRFGAYVRGKAETLIWSGDTEAAKAARAWLLQNDVFVYRQKRLAPGMVDSDFIQTPVDQQHRTDYQSVDKVYQRAAQYVQGAAQSLQLKAHRVNTLKRILEASKMDAAVARAKQHAADGRQVVIFVETKAERVLGRFRKKEEFQDERLYDYPAIREAMDEWRRATMQAKSMGESGPPSPFAEFIEHLARAYDEAGLEVRMPSVKDYLSEKLGPDQAALYTGDESDAKAGQFLQDWRDGKRRYLIATMAKGGTGLSLHDVIGDRPRAQVGINLPWKATGVDQVTGRTARYGMKSKTRIEWLFTPDIPFEQSLAARVGARMADMGATVRGVDVKDADRLKDFDFTMASPDIVYGEAGPHQDLTDHFTADRSVRTDLTAHEKARRWVIDRQAEKPVEFMVLVREDGSTAGAGTKNEKGTVGPSPEITPALIDGTERVIAHHNHPSGRSLSRTDFQVLAVPGIREIWAHNAAGASWAARLSTQAETAFRGFDGPTVQGILKEGFDQVTAVAYGMTHQTNLDKLIDSGVIERSQANVLADRIVLEAAHLSGIFDVATNAPVDPLFEQHNLRQDAAAAAWLLRKVVSGYTGTEISTVGREAVPGIDRSPFALRLGRGMGQLLSGDARTPPPEPRTQGLPTEYVEPRSGAVPERAPTFERTDQGLQQVIPGAERAGADELAARQRQRDRELAELRMRGRARGRKGQQGPEDLPLFGGKKPGTLLEPEEQYHFFEATWPDGLRTVDAVRGRTVGEGMYAARRGFPDASIRGLEATQARAADSAFTRLVLGEPEETYGDDGQVARFDDLIGKPKKSLREKVSDMIGTDLRNRLAEGLADRLRGLEVLERAATPNGDLLPGELSPTKLARIQGMEASRLVHDAFYLGVPKWHQGAAIIDESVRPYGRIVDEDIGKNAREWRVFLYGKRGAEYRALGKRLFSGMPIEEENAMVDAALRLGQRFPQFERAFADYRRWWNGVLDFIQASGKLTDKARAFFDEMHKDYVPVHRIFDDDKSRMGKGRARMGFAGQNPDFWRLKGGAENIEDPNLAIARNVQRLIESSIRNVVMLRAEQANAAAGHAFMTTRKSAAKQVLVPITEMVRDLARLGLEVRPEDAVPTDAIRTLWSIGNRPRGDNIVSWLRAGKLMWAEVHSPMLYRALTLTNRFPLPPWMKILSLPKRVLTASVVLDPSYWAANAFRDSFNASMAYPGTFLPTRVLSGLIGQTERNPMFKLFVQSGGTMSAFDPVRGQLIKKVERKIAGHDAKSIIINAPDKFIQMVEHVGSKLENSPRFALFQQLIKEGKSVAEAAYQARDLTIDYTRKGSWGIIQFMTEVVPFFNASIQGIHKMGRVAAEHPTQFLLKGAMLTAASLGVWSLFANDQRYKDLTQDQKDLYLHFWVGDQHYKLPIPFEIGSMFVTVPIRLAELFSGRLKPGEFAQRLRFILMNNLRLDPTPQAVRPLVGLYSNWDDFREAPIVPPWLQTEVLPAERYDERTPLVAVKLGRALNVAPKDVEYLINGYFGNLGAYLMTASDAILRATGNYPSAPSPDLSDYMVLRRFLGPKTPRTTQALKDFYQMRINADELWGSIQRLAASGEIDRMKQLIQENKGELALRPALNDIADRMSKIDKAMRIITQNKQLTSEEKTQRLDQLRAVRNKIAAVMVQARDKMGM